MTARPPADPGRRRFVGGAVAVLLGAAATGCRDGVEDPPAAATGAGDGPNAGDLDLSLAIGQVEQTLAEAFGGLAEARPGDLAAAGLAERAAFHRDRHAEHARLLVEVLETAGADATAVARPFPGMDVPDDQDLAELPLDGLLVVLQRCEAAAAATALDAVGRLSLADLRGVVAGIGATDAGLHQAFALARTGIGGLDLTALADGRLPLGASYLAGSFP